MYSIFCELVLTTVLKIQFRGGYKMFHLVTLCREKPFNWDFHNNTLTIYKNVCGEQWKIPFTTEQLLQIVEYMKLKDHIPLANNVKKMRERTEKDGIGEFIYSNIVPKTKFAQCASQIMSIFCELGIARSNKAKIGILFTLMDDDLIGKLSSYVGS